ncbi:MAG TPA: flagellar hook-associated protein FlgL [bacterium]|nr:flagellar hook-associated protein FlgL [bacterium]HPN43218.1 flagellar hook-associated protein FlgL [bacterium]
MRITHDVESSQLLINLNKVKTQRQKYFNQLTSGKQLEKPSDDPAGAARVIQLNKVLAQSEYYQKNIDDAKSFLAATEASLSAVSENVQQALTIGLRGSSDTTGEEARKLLADQVDYILDRVLAESNRQYGNKYIFGGTVVKEAPFEKQDDNTIVMTNEDAIDNAHIRELLKGDQVQVNLSGRDVFIEGTNIFDTLVDLRNSLENNDREQIQAAYMQLQDAATQITRYSGIAGLRYEHVTNVEQTLADFKLQTEALRSSIEDADVATAAINYQSIETIYQANLQYGAKILQNSILDYLA